MKNHCIAYSELKVYVFFFGLPAFRNTHSVALVNRRDVNTHTRRPGAKPAARCTIAFISSHTRGRERERRCSSSMKLGNSRIKNDLHELTMSRCVFTNVVVPEFHVCSVARVRRTPVNILELRFV